VLRSSPGDRVTLHESRDRPVGAIAVIRVVVVNATSADWVEAGTVAPELVTFVARTLGQRRSLSPVRSAER